MNLSAIEPFEMKALNQVPEKIQTVLKQFDSYEAPIFVLLYSDAKRETINLVYQQVIDKNNCEASEWLDIQDGFQFTHLFCNYQNANFIAFDLTDALIEQGFRAKVSVFRHNSIGEAQATYRWNVKQLLSLIPTPDLVAINDFCDKNHWQGIRQYLEADREEQFALGDSEPEAIERPSQAFGISIVAPLQELYPFIVNLPHGSGLWQYVVTGDYQGQTPLERCLVDLDSVLLLLHAEQHSPKFYKHILRICGYDSIPAQNCVLSYLDKILEPLTNQLLVEIADSQSVNQYLRVLDIFFHIFDQQDVPKKIRDRLSKKPCSSYISTFELEQRYTYTSSADDGNISAKTKQKIIEIVDSLDRYYICDDETLNEIEPLFSSSRHTFNYTLWQREDSDAQSLCRLVGAILLTLDDGVEHGDNYNTALHDWVTDGLRTDVIKHIQDSCNSSVPQLENWLFDGQLDAFAPLVKELTEKLELSSLPSYDVKIGVVQPKYSLLSSVGIFRPILATCYWLYKATKNEFAKRVVLLCSTLAPQATISSLSRLLRDGLRGFASQGNASSFYSDLEDLGVSDEVLFAFQVNLAVQYDVYSLERLVNQYAKRDPAVRERLNESLSKLSSWARDYFYLNVHRLHRNLQTPLRSYRDIVIREVISAIHNREKDFDIASAAKNTSDFLNGKLSFKRYQNLTREMIDASQLDLPPEFYDAEAPKILPQILIEPRLRVQLRWVQLFCCDSAQHKMSWLKAFRRCTTRNHKLQTLFLEHLFFEKALHEGDLSFSERGAIDLDDLTPEWLEYWEKYEQRLSKKIKSL